MAEALCHRISFLVNRSTGKSIVELIVLLVIFAFVLVACILTTRFIAGHQMQRGKNGNFKPIETYQIAQNRYLHLVQVGQRYFVVSVTKENINFIAELKEEELVVREEKQGGQRSFKEILSQFKAKVDKHDDTQE